jgi:hypothetical protein
MTTFVPGTWGDYFTVGPDDFAPRTLIVTGHVDPLTSRLNWRCLTCLAGGQGADSVIALGVAAHALDCFGDTRTGLARFDMLEAISDASQAVYMAGWHGSIEKVLLERGGMWTLLAERLGWPFGYRGLQGWDLTLEAAYARHGLSPAEVTAPEGATNE